MILYRYLGEAKHAEAWVQGGTVPLFLAKKYVSDERIGIMTPDERQIIDTNLDYNSTLMSRVIGVSEVRNIDFSGVSINGVPQPDFYGDMHTEDGRILCLSVHLGGDLAKRMEKTTCVEISDINRLMHCIDKQLGVSGRMGLCAYTRSHNRNHFLKSHHDSWQAEYRLFWSVTKDDQREMIYIDLPAGIGRLVDIPPGSSCGPQIEIVDGPVSVRRHPPAQMFRLGVPVMPRDHRRSDIGDLAIFYMELQDGPGWTYESHATNIVIPSQGTKAREKDK